MLGPALRRSSRRGSGANASRGDRWSAHFSRGPPKSVSRTSTLAPRESRSWSSAVRSASAASISAVFPEESSHATHCGLLHALTRWNAPLWVAERPLSIAHRPLGMAGTSLLDSCDEGRGVEWVEPPSSFFGVVTAPGVKLLDETDKVGRPELPRQDLVAEVAHFRQAF